MNNSPSTPWVGLSLMLEDDYRQAAYPLFEAGAVEVIEWSFDMGWGQTPPDWAMALVDFYAAENRLLGHGVTFSALSAQWTPRQDWWLENFEQECQHRSYVHVSEHFGFLSAGSFHEGAPLPVPRNSQTLKIGRNHLQKLAALTDVPIGLENLAFAFGLQDVREQGQFLEELLDPIDGFLLLDLHNIYCQMCNFDLNAEESLAGYPLHRVRELHVSGGSWSTPSTGSTPQPVRRDTHDEATPDEVFDLVELALQKCPDVQAVIMERLGGTLPDEKDAESFRADYHRLQEVVAKSHHAAV